jgi:hypothetical protein
MPTVLRSGAFRVYFYSHEPNERAHVHVELGHRTAKFWLDPVTLAWHSGLNASELRQATRLVRQHSAQLLEKWDDFFSE